MTNTIVVIGGSAAGAAKQVDPGARVVVAVAHTTQCPYCIQGHSRLATRKGASPQEIMEAIWVAAEMRAGGAYAHSTLALNALANQHS